MNSFRWTKYSYIFEYNLDRFPIKRELKKILFNFIKKKPKLFYGGNIIIY